MKATELNSSAEGGSLQPLVRPLGSVDRKGFDYERHEHRERLSAITDCPRCGKRVELWEETNEWHKDANGNWVHSQYSGCATGECCGLLFADDWDGCRAFYLDRPNK